MKNDLYTKFILTVIAFLLTALFLSNSDILVTKQVEAAPAAFLQVGQKYEFLGAPGVTECKVLSLGANGWVKTECRVFSMVSSGKENTAVYWVNTDLVPYIQIK